MTKTAPIANLRRDELNAINSLLVAKTSMHDIEEFIEEKRKDIFDILSSGRAEGNEDADKISLENINKTLEDKKTKLEENLGKVTPSFNIEHNNNDLIKYCKSIQDDEDDSNKNGDLADECSGLLTTLQNVYTKGKTERLFSGKKPSSEEEIEDLLESDTFEKIISSTNESDLRKNIKDLIDDVYKKDDNSFSINKNSLYTKQQAEIAARIAIFLHCMKKALEEGRIADTTEIEEILDNLKDEQIPKIRGLYNIKKEKDAVEAMYNTIIDIKNNDTSDIDWTDTTPNINLTDSFESKSTDKAKNIDFYYLNRKNITIDPITCDEILLKDASGEKEELNTQKNTSSGDYNIYVKIGLDEVKIGTICIDYTDKDNASFILIQSPKLFSDLYDIGIIPTGGIELNIPIMAVKNVSGYHTGQVSLTRNIKANFTGAPTPTGTGAPTPTGTGGPAPTIEAKEWTATISNVENIHSEEAAYIAEEKDREEFDKLGELSLFKLGTRHPWERLKHFVSREYKRKKAIEKHMHAIKGKIDIRRESVVSAANRHELENSDTQRKGNIDSITTHENPDVNQLCVRYLMSNMSDSEFEREFNIIIANDPVLEGFIKSGNLNYLGSNILLKLKQERAEQILLDKIGRLLLKDINLDAANLEMKDTYNESNFKAELKRYSDEYFQSTQSNFPPEIRKLLDKSSDKDQMLPILQNWKAQLQANVKNLKMQLQLLTNTTGAYEINNEDREKSLWQKFGNWMDNHRIMAIGGSAVLGIGMVTLPTLFVGGALGTGIATTLFALKAGVISAAKKASHYTKEQKGQEKRLTHGLNIEKKELENVRKVMEGAPRLSWRHYKARRQYNLYQTTTQQRIADTEILTKKIQDVLSSTINLEAPENVNKKNILAGYLTNALARLDYYKESGHNFVASQNRTKVEQDFNKLYKAVQDAAFRLNESHLSDTHPRSKVIEDGLDSIRSSSEYDNLRVQLREDYEKALSTFKRRRRNLEARYFIGTAAVTAGTAVFTTRLRNNLMAHYHTVATTTTTIPGTPGTPTTQLHPDIKNSLLRNGVPSSKITAIENALNAAPSGGSGPYNPEAFWTIVKNETGRTDVQINDWMSNSFMKDVLWELKEGGKEEFITALKDGGFDTLTPSSPQFIRAETFLSSPRIGIIKPGEGTTILKNLQDYLSGAKSYTSFSPEMRIKMGHFGHMAIHNDIGTGSRLSEEVLKNVIPDKPMPIDIPTDLGSNHFEREKYIKCLDGVGMTLYGNNYRKRLKPKDRERGVVLENTNPGEIPEGEGSITTDPDGTPGGPSSGSAPSWL